MQIITDARVVVDVGPDKYLVPLYSSLSIGDAVGCFSKSLLHITCCGPRHADRPNAGGNWLEYTGVPRLGHSPPVHGTVFYSKEYDPADWTQLPPSKEINFSRWWTTGRELCSVLRRDEKLMEKGFEGVVSYLKKNYPYGLFVIGDNLRDTAYDTKVFVDYLMTTKTGSITCSPAVINPSHSSDPRYCMAWFWVPPWNTARAIPVPQEHVNLEPKRRALSGYPEKWKARLQAAKPAMKPRKKEVGGELNQVSNV